MTQHLLELFIELIILLAVYVFARGFDERITVLEEEKSETITFKAYKTGTLEPTELTFKKKIKTEEQRMNKAVKPKRVNK